MNRFKMIVLSIAMFASTSVFAYDEIKCIKYMEGDQHQVMQMIKKDLNKAAKTKDQMAVVNRLDVDTMVAAGYAMYCIENQDIDMMKEIGAK